MSKKKRKAKKYTPKEGFSKDGKVSTDGKFPRILKGIERFTPSPGGSSKRKGKSQSSSNLRRGDR